MGQDEENDPFVKAMLDKFERDTDPNKGEVRPPPPPGPENGSDLSQNSNEELLDPNYSMDE